MKESNKIFYGWWVVLVITILFFIPIDIEYCRGPYRNISRQSDEPPQPENLHAVGFYNQRVVHAAH